MRILAVASALLSICSLAHGQSYSQQNQQYYPTWWLNSSAPVVDVTKAEGNFAIANLGQLKWMALQAKYHLDVALADQGGSGASVSSMVAGFGTTGNYVAVNLGQLKAVAKPFYDRLLEVGYNTNTNLKANGLSYLWSSDYPWDPQTPVAQNYVPATIGQLKLAFSFDLIDSDADGNLDYTADVYPAYSETRNTDGDIYPDFVDPEPNALPSPTPLPPAVGNYYVDPTVATSGNGETPATAKKTIEEVRQLLRNVNKAAVNGNIKVNLMPGSYYLKTPITFDSGDSGYGANNIVYQSVNSSGAYAPGLAKIHSGAQLSGWTQVVNSYGQTVWRAYPSDLVTNPDFSGVSLSSLASVARTIVDTTNVSTETFGWLARNPNQAGANPHANPNPGNSAYKYAQIDHSNYQSTADGGKFTPSPQTSPVTNLQITYASGFNPIASAAEISASPMASVLWWGPQNTAGNPNNWATKENQLTNIDTVAKKLWLYSYLDLDQTTSSGAFSNVPGIAQRYYLQGLPSLLDAGGEFFFAADGSYVDYKPVSGVSGAPLVRVPVSSQLIVVNGANNLMFNGIEFAFTQCTSPKTFFGAVQINSGSYISLNQCHIHHVGSFAVIVNPGAQHNSILNSWIHESGIGGIYMLGGDKSTGKITSYNTVSNCLIQNVGCIITDAKTTGGVVLEGTQNCIVQNSRVSGSSRYGVSLRGDVEIVGGSLQIDPVQPISRQNTISDVQLDHCASDSGDSAALHMVGINKNATASGGNKNTFLRMFIRYTFLNPTVNDIGPWGIYVDRHGGGTLHQIFRHIKSRDEDNELVGYHDNANPTQQTFNVTWEGSFNNSAVDWPNIASSANAIPGVFTGAAGPLQ